MSTEIWRIIPFAPRYLASSKGNIMGLRGTLLRPRENYRGYLVCDLHKIQYRVNRVICQTFHGEPPTSEHHAAHKDNNKRNNREDNLYWATPQENSDDLSASGVNKGVNAWRAYLTEDEIRYIRAEHAKGYKIIDIANEFPQVCYATISHIVHRRTYKDVQ